MEEDFSSEEDQKYLETESKSDPLAFVEYIKLGVWDLYILRTRFSRSYFPMSWKIEECLEINEDLPYLWMTLRDASSVAFPLLSLYLVIKLANSLIPALRLWFSGQVLGIAQSAIDNRAVDAHFLFWVAGGCVLCKAAEHLLRYASARVADALDIRFRRLYSGRIFRSMARLDVPTWDDPAVSSHFEELCPDSPRRHTLAWTAIESVAEMVSAFLRIFFEAAVLFRVLREQQDGSLLVLVSFASEAVSFFAFNGGFRKGKVWAAIPNNRDYLKMEGLNLVVTDTKHRKELVAGGLDEFVTAEYCRLADQLGGSVNDFSSMYHSSLSDMYDPFGPINFLKVPLEELPQIIFTLQAVQKPTSIPVSLASLHLLQQSLGSFVSRVYSIYRVMGRISRRLSDLRRLHEAENIPNKVADGTNPFPENLNVQSIRDGISLEFRNVSFQYPGSERYALRDISFSILPGQLCVIVGSNGSGKSTILKLVARIYDPVEGSILIDGHDIKTLRLADLRRAIAILFQDYTHFPLSIRDNIAMGNPRCAHDNAAIEEAARLGGASELVAQLSDGLDTYLERPVHTHYSGTPESVKKLLSRKAADAPPWYSDEGPNQGLSGGQMQRLAVARTFMRSSTMEQEVGLLLFDEPSAALDPAAEHELFSRLRKLRGSKTMIFSTHRFGNLTRHADLILYMNDSVIVEAGTHEELLKREDSDYRRLWQIQAQAFL